MVAVNYGGRQLAGRLGWVAPVYHKKACASPHPGVCMFSLEHNRRPDGRFGTRNLISHNGKWGEVCGELRKRVIDVRCLQEVRWTGHGARILGMKGRRY